MYPKICVDRKEHGFYFFNQHILFRFRLTIEILDMYFDCLSVVAFNDKARQSYMMINVSLTK